MQTASTTVCKEGRKLLTPSGLAQSVCAFLKKAKSMLVFASKVLWWGSSQKVRGEYVWPELDHGGR